MGSPHWLKPPKGVTVNPEYQQATARFGSTAIHHAGAAHEDSLGEGDLRGRRIGDRHVALGVDEGILRELPVEGFQQAVVGRQIVAEPPAEIHHREADQSLEVAVHGPVRHGGRRAGQPECHPVALLHHLQIDLQQGVLGTDGVEEARLPVDAIVDSRDLFPGRLAGHLQHASQCADQEIRALLRNKLPQSPLGDATGGEARLDIEDHGARVAGHVGKHGENVFLQCEVLPDLDRRYQQAFVVTGPRAVDHSARLRAAALPGMHRRADEAHQLPVGEYRNGKSHVGVMHAAVEWVVEKEGVALRKPHRRFVPPVLDDVFDRYLRQHRVVVDAGGADRQVSLRGVDAERHIAPAHGRGGSELHRRLLAFQGDHVGLVLEDLELEPADQRLCLAFPLGLRFRAKALDDFVIAAIPVCCLGTHGFLLFKAAAAGRRCATHPSGSSSRARSRRWLPAPRSGPVRR